MLYIDVPEKEMDLAKSLGAEWDEGMKSLFVRKRGDYCKFGYWITKDEEYASVLLDAAYFVTEPRKCRKCDKTITVVGFCPKSVMIMSSEPYFDEEENPLPLECVTNANVMNQARKTTEFIRHPTWTGILVPEPLPDFFIGKYGEELRREYHYYPDSLKPGEEPSHMNHCPSCGAAQVDWDVYQEVDSFNPFNDEQAKRITFHKVRLTRDIIMQGRPGCTTASFRKSRFVKSDFVLP